jgi:hypothetical protein
MSARRRKIVTLADARQTAAPGVVEALEAMLARAKAGEIRAVAMAAVTTGRGASTGWVYGDMQIPDLWYAVRCLENRMTTVPE